MVVVRDRETPENANAWRCESEQKRVYGDAQDKGNDCTAGDHEARVQREQFRVVLQKLFALDPAVNGAIQQSGSTNTERQGSHSTKAERR
jgi:hypothetical protein